MSEKFDKGMEIRRKVLGDTHVDKSFANKTEFDADFQDFITETAWGSTWSREGILSHRDRSLLTLCLLAAGGNEAEFELHLRATVNTGATKEEVREMLMHTAVYAGIPVANHYIKIAKEIYDEMESE